MADEVFNRIFDDYRDIIIENLILSLLCAVGILVVFFLTYRNISVNSSFMFTLIILPPVACMVAQVITNDIVLAVGMVGALSIVRFRHSMKESKNLVFVFWAVTAGIACGLSLRSIAITANIIIAVFVLIVHVLTNRRRYGSLSVRTIDMSNNKNVQGEIEKILEELSLTYEMKYKDTGNVSNILYEFRNKKGIDKTNDALICEKIMSIAGVSSVKLIKM